MEWANPVEWISWLYGKLFLNHVYLGGAIVVAAFAIVGLVLWVRGVDKYKEEHPKVQSAPKGPESAEGSNYVPPPGTGLVIDNSSKVTFKNSGFSGYSTGAILRDNSHDLLFDNFTVTSSANATNASFTTWKQKLFDDAGSPPKIKADFDWLKKQMEPVWAQNPGLKEAAEKQFQLVENDFMEKASDKEATRQLLSRLVASPKDKPPQ
jgi:hypothetical protein